MLTTLSIETASNIDTAKAWFEVIWNQKRVDRIEEFATEESVAHLEVGDVSTKDAFAIMHSDWLAAFPDLHVEIEDAIAQDDKVVVRWRTTATHAGHGLGLPPTNRSVSAVGLSWMRFSDGKIVEAWDCWNFGGLLTQLRQ